MKKRFTILHLVGAVVLSFEAFAGGICLLLKSWVGSPWPLMRLAQTLHLIQQHYVGEVDQGKLYDGALKGMVSILGDPYSSYLNHEDFASLSAMTEGHFGGVGMVMGVKDGQFIVVAPIEDTPAFKAGIKAGAVLTKIDGKELKGLSLDQVVKQIRGQNGTQVVLTLQQGKENPKEYTIVRSDIKIKSVYGKMDDHGIGYIRITNFSEDTAKDFGAELQKLQQEGMKALVLDLRDNPGGLLQSGVGVARYLVPKGPIVSITDKQGRTDTETSSLEKVAFPLAVLVNHGTASAAEIVSGAIQDTHTGKLFGTKTYGKGVVQNVYMLGSDTALKLTIANYYTPSGRSIDKVGITPDQVVAADDDAGSNQLTAAEAYLKEQLRAK